MNMNFQVDCVKNYLAQHGFVFTVRSYNLADSDVTVPGVGLCSRQKISDIASADVLEQFVAASGFNVTKEWCNKIASFGAMKGCLYLVRVKVPASDFDAAGNLIKPAALAKFGRFDSAELQSKKLDDMFDPALADSTAQIVSRRERFELQRDSQLDIELPRDKPEPSAEQLDTAVPHFDCEDDPVGAVPFRIERATSELDIMLDEYDAQFAHSILPDLHQKVSMDEQLRLCELHDIAQAAMTAAAKIEGGWLL